jgi:Flp pilus assembly protein TadG
MAAGSLVIIIGVLGLAFDFSQLYNRQAELQNVADAAALAAASELDGTNQGVVNALQKASDRFTATPPGQLTYQYGKLTMTWSEQAMEFASAPTGPWKSAGEAKAQPGGLLFVKMDTSGLNGRYGEVSTLFMQFFTNTLVASTKARAVAGRSAIKVTPLGICAMRDERYRNHNTELEEYGYRRGVSYNLLDLNKPDASAGQTFIVNPLDSPTAITDVATLAPFVCTGTMAMARLTGGKVTVSPSFPIGTLFSHLNSRFGVYTGATAPCDARTAPSDTNVKQYTYNGGSQWMQVQPLGQSAALLRSDGRRWTVTGPDTTPSGTTDVQYGPLWSYAKAVQYSSYEDRGEPEPAGGYTTFDVSAWNTLYDPGKPRPSTTTPYPSGQDTPYSSTGATFFLAPPAGNKSVANRRVLNLPLLECPVAGSKAKVLGIGKFFMTVQATSTSLYGEFAGLASEEALGSQVQLYP